MALLTLRAMALGGMRDHLGGGFHRYSVDADWRVPHFEKMLYDQAQLVHAYVDAAQLTRRPAVRRRGRRHAALRAARPDRRRRRLLFGRGRRQRAARTRRRPGAHKMEGAFYIWSDAEVRRLLGDLAEPFCQRYGVAARTATRPSTRRASSPGKNLLHTARSLEDVAEATGRTVAGPARGAGRRSRGAVQRAAERPRPHLDDKVLTAWNGLMIGAFGAGGPHPGRRVLRRDGGAGARRFSEVAAVGLRPRDAAAALPAAGTRPCPGYAEDYAYLAGGLLELFQATGDPAWLEWALTLHRRLDDLFADPIDGGWFSTTGRGCLGAAAPQGAARRRRAGGHVGGGAEPAGAGAPDRREHHDGRAPRPPSARFARSWAAPFR